MNKITFPKATKASFNFHGEEGVSNVVLQFSHRGDPTSVLDKIQTHLNQELRKFLHGLKFSLDGKSFPFSEVHIETSMVLEEIEDEETNDVFLSIGEEIRRFTGPKTCAFIKLIGELEPSLVDNFVFVGTGDKTSVAITFSSQEEFLLLISHLNRNDVFCNFKLDQNADGFSGLLFPVPALPKLAAKSPEKGQLQASSEAISSEPKAPEPEPKF